MIIIDKAVLHIMDLNSGMTVYSDEELSIKDSIETFLLKHIVRRLSLANFMRTAPSKIN